MRPAACLVIAAAVVGCGGKVVVDRDQGGGGSGGGSSRSGSSSSHVAVSSSSGMSGCFDSGDCTECIGCAANGPCQALYAAVSQNPDAGAFWVCFDGAQC